MKIFAIFMAAPTLALSLSWGLLTAQAEPAGEEAAVVEANADTALDREAELARINDYLNGLETLHGRFVQVAPDGALAEGAFYLRRPGRLRFEYDPPHPLLIVSDGTTVAQTDRELETTDRAPLRTTPLHFFLKKDVNLTKDVEVSSIEKGGGLLAVTARDEDDENDGEVTLVFAQPALELREWIVTDGLGQQTRIALLDTVRDERLDPRLFLVEQERRRRR